MIQRNCLYCCSSDQEVSSGGIPQAWPATLELNRPLDSSGKGHARVCWSLLRLHPWQVIILTLSWLVTSSASLPQVSHSCGFCYQSVPVPVRNTTILNMVDRFSKTVHFIPLPKLLCNFGSIRLISATCFSSPWCHYGLCVWGRHFSSQVWVSFCEALGATASLSTRYQSIKWPDGVGLSRHWSCTPLASCFIGPFEIEKLLNPHAVCLWLPSSPKIYPTFHVSLLNASWPWFASPIFLKFKFLYYLPLSVYITSFACKQFYNALPVCFCFLLSNCSGPYPF